jgi:hypothetical protein
MANRYWVGGNGTWNLSATTNWSAASNGSSGASAPTPGDDVFFDINSNTGVGNWTVTLGAEANCANFNVSGLDGRLTIALGTLYTNTLTVYGSINIPVATTVTNLYYSSTSPSWSSTLSNYFTTTNFIKVAMTSTSVAELTRSASTRLILGSVNITEVPVITTFASTRLLLGSVNMAQVPVIPTFVSTSLPFMSNNPLMLSDIPMQVNELFGESYSNTINPIPYQFWG